MAQNESGNGQQPGEGANQQGAAPQINILGQYLKDLSFENPNAPESFNIQGAQPQISINVNVNANQLGETDYEVTLELEAHAEHEGKVIFHTELAYAGIFRLQNIPAEMLGPAVLIECPRMLFPFARRILADATRDGGFPPLMLDPIDFAAMYAQRVQQEQQAAEQGDQATS